MAPMRPAPKPLETKSYRGLCIGGPADGELREAKNNWFLAVRMMGTETWKAFEPGEAMPITASVQDTVRYEHVEMVGPGYGFGFWVRANIDNAPQHIMRQLITSYERKEGSK